MPEPIKVFNNLIIGQYVLTNVPIKVYVESRYLTITDVDDIEDPSVGFGMDENGAMQQFDYRMVNHLLVAGNTIDIETYNKAIAGPEEPAELEEPAEEEPKKEESISMKLKDLIKENFLGELPSSKLMKMKYNPLSEISQEEVDAEMEAAESEIDAAKAKEKAAKAAVKDTVKGAKDKIKAAKASMKVAEEGIVNELGPGEIDQANPFNEPEGKDPHHEELVNLVQGMAFNAYDDLASSIPVKDTNEMMEWIYSLSDGEAMAMTRRIKKGDFGLYESHEGSYTFGTGDIVHDVNPGCPHFGSKGMVIQIPSQGIIRYTVTNTGDNYRPGDILTKSADQLEKI